MHQQSITTRINKVLGTKYFKKEERRKFILGAITLILLSGKEARENLGSTFEASKVEKLFKEKYKLSKEEIDVLFHDYLRKTYREGTHKVYELFVEFENDPDVLVDYAAFETGKLFFYKT